MTKQSKRRGLRVLAATFTATALILGTAACGGGADGEGATGGVLIQGAYSEMAGFDPVQLTFVGTGLERGAAIMDTLLYRDEITDEIKPKLAESIETPDDGSTWVLGLREGVDFTDGTPLDAEAVVFNINRHIAPDSTSSAKPMLAGLQTVEATGDLEVTFTLAGPDAFFPIALTGFSPAGLIGSPKALADPKAFSENPVGAGPFTMSRWVRDDRLELVKNNDYWEEGKPFLDGVTYLIQGDNKTRADALLSGETHIAQANSEFLNQFEGNDQFTIWDELPAGGTLVIPNNASGPGTDVGLREAISLAFDPKVTQQILFPNSTAWNGNMDCVPFANASPACNPDAGPTFDLEKAKDLVKDYVADGGKTQMEMVHFQSLTTAATYVQQQLNEIGLDVKLKSLDAAGLAEVSTKGTFELMMTQTAAAGYPNVWNRFYSQSPNNWPRQVRPAVDEQLLKIRTTLEPAEAAKEWQVLADMVAEEHMVTWFSPYTARNVASASLKFDDDRFTYEGSTFIYVDSIYLDE